MVVFRGVFEGFKSLRLRAKTRSREIYYPTNSPRYSDFEPSASRIANFHPTFKLALAQLSRSSAQAVNLMSIYMI